MWYRRCLGIDPPSSDHASPTHVLRTSGDVSAWQLSRLEEIADARAHAIDPRSMRFVFCAGVCNEHCLSGSGVQGGSEATWQKGCVNALEKHSKTEPPTERGVLQFRSFRLLSWMRHATAASEQERLPKRLLCITPRMSGLQVYRHPCLKDYLCHRTCTEMLGNRSSPWWWGSCIDRRTESCPGLTLRRDAALGVQRNFGRAASYSARWLRVI
eukprot:2993214-Amphidinium_carterae.1